MPELTEEDLKKMSPEQLMELQKQNCVFCQIVSGKVSSKKVYEDDEVIAILDINPANPGHMLLMPKEHYAIMPQLPESTISKVFMVAKGLSKASLNALKARGSTVFVANGLVAGQRAPHFMIHIIPREPNDGLDLRLPEYKAREADLEKVKEKIKEKLDQLLGIKKPISLKKMVERLGEKKESKKKEKKVVDAEFKEEKDKKIDLDRIAELLK